MKIVVVGGSGLIGSRVVQNLKNHGHEVIVASPSKGINTVTGDGMVRALKGADSLIDVSDSPSFEDRAVVEFFETSTRNLTAIAELEGVKHYVALSVVGADKLLGSGYFRAKMAQERLIKQSKVPFTILRATQFFERLDNIVKASFKNGEIVVPKVLLQPIAAEDVSNILTEVVLNKPLNGSFDIAGPEQASLYDFIRMYLKFKNDSTKLSEDEKASYFGLNLKNDSLVPERAKTRGSVDYNSWISIMKSKQQ